MVTLDGDDEPTEVDLSNEEKKLFEDNTSVMCKLMECVCDELLVPMHVAGGENESVYKVKRWLEEQFDTLKDLREKLWSSIRPFLRNRCSTFRSWKT